MDDDTLQATHRSPGTSMANPVRFEDTKVRLRRTSPARCVVGIDIDLVLGNARGDGATGQPGANGSEFDLDSGEIDAMLAGSAVQPEAAPAAPHPARGRWKFDRNKFFHGYAAALGKLGGKQIQGLNALLAAAEADAKLTDIRCLAYMLATVRHECANTWRPIEEYGRGKGQRYGKPVTVTDPQGKKHTNVYYGRGYVQLTWEHNYAKMGKLLKNRLLYTPSLALHPAVAYKIMSLGMRLGIFTGKKLADYIHGSKRDYVNARRIINGLDRAQTIAGYAVKLERILRRSAIPQPTARPSALEAPVETFA